MSEKGDLRYFDYAATTPADPRVIEAMFGCLGIEGDFGNPASSSHGAGLRARRLVEQARKDVAALIGADAHDIVWTSGATESNNLALKGYADRATERRHLITSQLEHKAILDTMTSLEARGMAVTRLAPTAEGEITAQAVEAALRPDTGLVSLMLVNNELGTLTDIAAIARVVHAAGALLHVDAAQALGKTPIDVKAAGIDLLSMSAHKVYGPKGIGALYVSREAFERIAPQMHGGGHERGLRSGTLATHQIVGMGVACELARNALQEDSERIARLGERLLAQVLAVPGVTLNGARAAHSPHAEPHVRSAGLLPVPADRRPRDFFDFGLQLGCRHALARAHGNRARRGCGKPHGARKPRSLHDGGRRGLRGGLHAARRGAVPHGRGGSLVVRLPLNWPRRETAGFPR